MEFGSSDNRQSGPAVPVIVFRLVVTEAEWAIFSNGQIGQSGLSNGC